MKSTHTLFAAALLAATATARAQSVATVAVNAIVVSSVSATTTNPLSFGSVTQGGSGVVIAPNSASAGAVSLTGANNAVVHMAMTSLPDSLIGPNGAFLHVGSYTECYLLQTAQQSLCGSTAVTQGGILNASLSSTGLGFLFMGATLSAPSVTQTVGSYTANMTITVTSP